LRNFNLNENLFFIMFIGCIIFLIGILGFVLNRKNIILMLISIEIMLFDYISINFLQKNIEIFLWISCQNLYRIDVVFICLTRILTNRPIIF